MIIEASEQLQQLLQQSKIKQSRCEGMVTKKPLIKVQFIQQSVVDKNYKCICFLYAKSQNKLTQIGTAFLISHNYCLTAAHNLFVKNSKYKLLLDDIYVYPAVNKPIFYPTKEDSNNFIKIINHRFPDQYKQYEDNRKNQYDFALLELQTSVIYDRYLALAVDTSSKDLIDKQCTVSGYPGNKISKINTGQSIVQQHCDTGSIIQVKDNIILHKANTDEGQSGSPIMVTVKNQVYAVGIHTYYTSSRKLNSGIFLSQKYVAMIARWMKEMALDLTLSRIKGEEVKVESCLNFLQKTEWQPQNGILVNQSDQIEYFDFNWKISTLQDRNLIVNGKQLTKFHSNSNNKIFTNSAIICSHEQFPNLKCTRVTGIIKNISGTIWVGLVTEEKKQSIYEQKEDFSQFYQFSELAYEINADFMNFGRIYANKSIIMPNTQNLFVNQGDSMSIQVNYPKRVITLYLNQVPKIDVQIPGKLVNSKLYLCVSISHAQNSILFSPLLPK